MTHVMLLDQCFFLCLPFLHLFFCCRLKKKQPPISSPPHVGSMHRPLFAQACFPPHTCRTWSDLPLFAVFLLCKPPANMYSTWMGRLFRSSRGKGSMELHLFVQKFRKSRVSTSYPADRCWQLVNCKPSNLDSKSYTCIVSKLASIFPQKKNSLHL